MLEVYVRYVPIGLGHFNILDSPMLAEQILTSQCAVCHLQVLFMTFSGYQPT